MPKQFNLRRPASEPAAPEEVILNWTDAAGAVHQESFKAQPHRIPEALMMELPNMPIDANSVAMFRLFEVVFDDDYQRFHQFITDPDRQVQAEDLVEIIQWCVEVRSDRPTSPSSSS